LRLKMAFLDLPGKSRIMRCSAPPPLNVDEARKIRVTHSPPRVSLRQR
jgi:hypothetical protein